MATWLFVVVAVLAMLVCALPLVGALVWSTRRSTTWTVVVFVVGIVGYVPAVALAVGYWVLNPLQVALGVTG